MIKSLTNNGCSTILPPKATEAGEIQGNEQVCLKTIQLIEIENRL